MASAGNVLDVFVSWLLKSTARSSVPKSGMSSGRSRSAGDLDGENVQSVVRSLLEGALRRRVRKIHVGGGDDADVHALRVRLPPRPFRISCS